MPLISPNVFTMPMTSEHAKLNAYGAFDLPALSIDMNRWISERDGSQASNT
jgi:hypothetical protein